MSQPSAPHPGARPAGRVVVGVDGSVSARAALAWAMSAAARHGAALEAVGAYPVDTYWLDVHLQDPRRVEAFRGDTERQVRALVAEVRAEVPTAADVPVEVVMVPGPAAERLVERAEDADLLVVGNRGRGAVRSTVIGSTALAVTAHAPCPVVVVHPSAPVAPPRVVVGIDDSAPARGALRVAAAEAARLGAELEVVAAYRIADEWSDIYMVVAPEADSFEDMVRQQAEQVVAEVVGTGRARVTVLEGPAGEVLVDHAEGAELLVVGSRGHSRLLAAALGSVALHCVRTARCPLLVVHPEHVERALASAPAVVARA